MKFKIPILEVQQKAEIISLVDKIYKILENKDYFNNSDAQNEVKQIEEAIDFLIYQLYGLTEEEIAIVEKSL